MKVLYLTMNPNRTSTIAPTEGWFRHLPERGLEPVLVSDRAGDFHTWTVSQGIPAYRIPLPTPSKARPWSLLGSLVQLRRVVKRHRIELIHCNEQNIYAIGQYLGRLTHLPVVVSVHFTMHRGFCSWAFANGRQPRRIFFVSRGNMELCRPALADLVPESRWRVLRNGIDLDMYRPDDVLRGRFREQHGLSPDEFVIGTACALRPRKQLEHLFEAASRSPFGAGRVLLAGGAVPGDEAYAGGMLREARRLLGDRLVHVGRLKDLRGFYNALDLFVNTSREEACSISVIEALACGCPIVGYPSKTVDEQVLPEGGEIVGQDRVDHLAAAIGRWQGDPARLAAARLGARSMAKQKFDIIRLSENLWSEYADVAAESDALVCS